MNKQLTPRDYQIEAVENLSNSFAKGNKRVLIVAATGAGKSVMIALIADRTLKKNPARRILILCHQGEILNQNEATINKINPDISTGIYCANLGRKDKTQSVILASRDSLSRNPMVCGEFDLIISDECHMISENKTSGYQKIFAALNPKWITGFTATPMRLGGGRIFGKDKFFEEVCYNIGIDKLVSNGYLTPYKHPKNKEIIDSSSVKKARGDFVVKDLDRVSGSQAIVTACVDEWWLLAKDRKLSIFFCCSVDHAKSILKALEKYLNKDEIGYIDGTSKNREEYFNKARNGDFKALVNITVLSVGVDVPIADTAVILRPTLSASLYIQCIGRILRLAPGKKDALILDFTDNPTRFENISEPLINEPNKNKRKINPLYLNKPFKECPECKMELKNNARSCGFCGELFLKCNESVFAESKSKQKVFFHHLEKSKTKAGEECYVLNIGLAGGKIVREWLLYKRANWLGRKAKAIMYKLQYQEKKIAWVKIDQASKYKNVVDYGWTT